jgi:hypothetical protein
MITQRYIVIDEDGLPIRKFYRRNEAKAFVEKRPEMKILVMPKIDVLSKLLDDIGQAPF